ncbi:MAG: glycine/sarcosine N-methyltransferase [Firmicutes bacterium]|nr:glycine/sarcosine N-methyltransferase [Bacillota bacterium]
MTREITDDTKISSVAGTEQEVQFIASVLNLKKGADLMDLYCGYGRHATELAKKGYNVTGVDATQAFLDIAQQKATDENIDITLRLCDMREIDYHSEFDAIINMFAAFGYFSDEENSQVLKRVSDSLKPGGLFLIDMINRGWMIQNNLNRYWRHPDGACVLSYKIELKRGVVTMNRILINQVTGAKTEHEFVLRSYSLEELAAILDKCGLKVIDTYGGFDFRCYGADSPRMIILAKKEN